MGKEKARQGARNQRASVGEIVPVLWAAACFSPARHTYSASQGWGVRRNCPFEPSGTLRGGIQHPLTPRARW